MNSIKEKFDEFGIANTDFITYQKLIRMSDEDIAEMDYKLIFLDECHHGTAPVWGQKTNYLMETHLDSIIFGTSATTVRNDGVNVVESLFEGNTISELPLSTAIARKVLPCPRYITAIYRLDDEFEKLKKRIDASTNTKEEKHEFYEKMKIMKSHFEKSYGIPTILNKYIKEKNGRYLVFCKNKKHLDTMRDVVIDWFRTAGIRDIHSYAVYSDYPDKEKDYKEFCEDNSDAMKILFSINMLNEGLHIKDISGVIMLRTTQSNLIYLQQLGRLVDADNIGKYLLVFDFVNNFSSVNDGTGLLKEIKDAVAREKESDPDFDDSGFEDIDTFFVLEQVVEIKEMFVEIERRLIGREWTEEENQILKEYYLIEGSKVAYRLEGRTRGAVKAQAKKLGLSTNGGKPWTEEEIKILKKYYPIEGYKVMERLKGRTKVSVQLKAEKLGLKISDDPWTKEEIDILKKFYPIEGCKVMKRLEGRTKGAIQAQANRLNLVSKVINIRKGSWTEEEIEILKRYYPIEGIKVKNKLNDRTNGAIMEQARRLGLKIKTRNNSWTEENNRVLRKYYSSEGRKVANRLDGKTNPAIQAQAKKLGLKACKKWTEKENGILKEYYHSERDNVADRLEGRTKMAIQAQARKLGLKASFKKMSNNKYKYVYKRQNKYEVILRIDGKLKSFGTFDSEEEAAKVAMEKAKEYGKAI